MKINILLFGGLKDFAGAGRITLDIPPDTSALKEMLSAKYPGIGRTGYKISVNQKLIREECRLHRGDEVALLPPFAGG